MPGDPRPFCYIARCRSGAPTCWKFARSAQGDGLVVPRRRRGLCCHGVGRGFWRPEFRPGLLGKRVRKRVAR
eukprot:6532176-Lingulodinium_polyedra.AAC.1